MADLDDKALKQLRELLKDAESCARLTGWEERFMRDMRARVARHGASTAISEATWAKLKQIEEKVYAI